MNESYREHPSEEALERFLLNMSPEEEVESVEMHILACGYCIEQLETLETHIAATRLALHTLESERRPKTSVATTRNWSRLFAIPSLSLGAVAAAGALLFFTIPRDVTVTAYRGTETAIVSEGRPLQMHLNAAGLNPGPINVELASQNGSVLWRGASLVRNDAVDVRIPRITESGPHFLRLSTVSEPGVEPTLVREFALNAQWTLK